MERLRDLVVVHVDATLVTFDPSKEEELLHVLNELILASLGVEFRTRISFDDVKTLIGLVQNSLEKLPRDKEKGSIRTALLISCLKLLRNLCSNSKDIQEIFCKEHFVLMKDLILQFVNDDSREEDILVMLKTVLQLLGNLCVNNERNQSLLWEICFPEVFVEVFRNVPPEVADLSCMILHVCTLKNDKRRSEVISNKTVISGVLKLSDGDGAFLEWTTILVESFLEARLLPMILDPLAEELSWEERFAVFNVFVRVCAIPEKEKMEEESPTDSIQFKKWVQEDSILVLVKEFCLLVDALSSKESVEALRSLLNPRGDTLPDHTLPDHTLSDHTSSTKLSYLRAILLLLCQLSSSHDYIELLQKQEAAVRASIRALKVICEIDGSFEKKQSSLKPENLRQTEAEEGNPFHGLKGNLVRLLGNLAYCSPTNQTLIADLDGFHLILNHFHVDHVNPYIAQWSTWAVRNLCAGHHANQKILSEMENNGPLNLQALEDNGFEVEIGPDGKLRVKLK